MHKREYVLSQSRRGGNRDMARLGVRFGAAAALPRRRQHVEFRRARRCRRPIAACWTQALALYDKLGAAGVRHFATEQLVEGVVLGRTGRLEPAEEWFVHYWGNKPGYDAEIARRLADAFIEGMSVKEAAARYREKPIDLPVEVRPTKRQKLARWMELPLRKRRRETQRHRSQRRTEAAPLPPWPVHGWPAAPSGAADTGRRVHRFRRALT